ncbi:MAG: MBOAT family protein [Gammaproteobacteria bacterium]|nr:MBOAT family protein [Gammaproteobacteria bacterium]
MIFPSYIFLFCFLPLVLLVWLSRLSFRFRLLFLTLASYVFYAWWDYRFVTLLAASTVVDFFCGAAIHRATAVSRKRLFLACSLVVNLSFLGFFKYYDFFVQSFAASFAAFGVSIDAPLLHIILPLGISFYTFQSISYSLDIYRGDAEPAPDFLHFAAYVSLFPQLIAGPIVRYGMMAEQIRRLQVHGRNAIEFSNGAILFIIGMSKKLLIADQVAPLADRLFDGTGVVQFGAAWLGTLAYSVQLYFDFSGYSDMAVGLGLMIGFRFPLNFLSPYKSKSISEFWNRWHITLSHFLRDYLFIPLGGSRGGLKKTARNLFITMFLGGLWHGAAWTFVVWGLFHGLLLAINTTWRTISNLRLPTTVAVLITFLCVHVGWVLFRAPSFARAREIYAGMLGLNGSEPLFAYTIQSATFGSLPNIVDIGGGVEVFPFLLAGLGIAFFARNSHELARNIGVKTGFLYGMLLLMCIASLGRETPFIYFQF